MEAGVTEAATCFSFQIFHKKKNYYNYSIIFYLITVLLPFLLFIFC